MSSKDNEQIYKDYPSATEKNMRGEALRLFRESPIPDDELLSNLALFISRQNLSRILFMHELYLKALSVHGVVMEFGVRWGQNLALFQNFRGIYEPFNHNRKIIGFDTFSGFPSIHSKDGLSDIARVGAYKTSDKYEESLEAIMNYHESESPISHLKKFEIVKGNAVTELKSYLERNPQTIVAFAYFDFDLYEPTKECLAAIKPHLTKGSVIGFDELNSADFPGETLALQEVFGLENIALYRSSLSPMQSYFVF